MYNARLPLRLAGIFAGGDSAQEFFFPSKTVRAFIVNALHEGLKTNQPFRINFDKDISVIIKINRDGSIAANFIPGDKAVEEYLKMNISTLRQRFDEQELSYSDLSYSRSRREQEQENKRKDKESSHE